MGQKTNPSILRIGKIKEWKSKYIEKKCTESSTLIFRDLEIKKLIFRLFAKNMLKVQNCRIYYSEQSLYIYISYYSYLNLLSLSKKSSSKYNTVYSKSFSAKMFNIKKSNRKRQLYAAKTYKSTFLKQPQFKLLQNRYFLDKKTQRLDIINNVKISTDALNHKTLNQQHTNLFVSKILKGLILFTNKKHNIFLNLKQTNKEITFFQTISKRSKYKLKENIAKLRKFQQNEFFKKGFSILTICVMHIHSSPFIAEFIADHLKKLKRPNFFLRFLKIALQILVNEKFSKFEQIQIKIKGRFNGAPRSNHKFINIGQNIPVLTINTKIDYGETTAYTSNGTFGIKVWAYTKIKNYNI